MRPNKNIYLFQASPVTWLMWSNGFPTTEKIMKIFNHIKDKKITKFEPFFESLEELVTSIQRIITNWRIRFFVSRN